MLGGVILMDEGPTPLDDGVVEEGQQTLCSRCNFRCPRVYVSKRAGGGSVVVQQARAQ